MGQNLKNNWPQGQLSSLEEASSIDYHTFTGKCIWCTLKVGGSWIDMIDVGIVSYVKNKVHDAFLKNIMFTKLGTNILW